MRVFDDIYFFPMAYLKTFLQYYFLLIKTLLFLTVAFNPQCPILLEDLYFWNRQTTILFFNPNHNNCVAETGYLADKGGPSAPDRDYSMLGP